MKTKLLVLAATILCLATTPGIANPFGDNGVDLQAVLDGITVGGPSSVDVTTDYLADTQAEGTPYDSYWRITDSTTAISTLVFKVTEAGYEDLGTFGVFDASDASVKVQLFDGAAVEVGDKAYLSILNTGEVVTSFYDASTGITAGAPTGIFFAGNLFGYYFDTDGLGAGNGGLWYSESSLNADQGADHMLAYQGGQGDTIQVPGYQPTEWTAGGHILAWEVGDITEGADRDYNDLVVMVESVQPVPVPGAVLLGLLGLGVAGRKLRKRA